jgi:hypothetical protein
MIIFFKKIKKENLVSFLILFSLLNLSFNPFNLFLGLGLLLMIVVTSLIIHSNYIVLLPFYFYPFLFILKSREPNNLILSALPEISVFISFFYFFLSQKILKYEKHLFFLLFLIAFFLVLVSFLHILDIYFLPALIRQYALPIIFLIIFINASLRKNELPMEAFKICIISYSIVSIVALLNYFKMIELLEYPRYRPSIFCINDSAALLLRCSEGLMPRALPLLGGSIGTSANILWMLGIAVILGCNSSGNHYLKYFSIPLFILGLLATSFSVIMPITYSLVVITLSKYKKYYKQILILLIIIFILFLTNFGFFGEETVFKYFKLTILTGIFDHFENIKIINFLFGSGPIISSEQFGFFPEKFIIDVGILRVLTETGFFNFFLFLLVLFYFLKKILWLEVNYPSNYNKSLLIMFLTLISAVHGNMAITSPFYPLFVMVVSSIVVQYRLKKNYLIK